MLFDAIYVLLTCIQNEVGTFREIEPICVLDFYVHESIQRRGVGYLLFEHMLQLENTNACKLAYDRPSSKLISFLKKRYGLSDYLPQSNNFVIFKRYFTTSSGYMDQRDSQLEWDTGDTTTEEAVAAPTAASTATPTATAGTSTNTLNPPTTTTVASSPRTPQRRSHDIITGLKTNNANDGNSDKSNNDGTRRGNKLSRTITVDEETDIGSVVDDDDTDSMCSSYASSYGNTSTGMHTPTKTSPYANSHNRVSTPNLNLRNTSSLHLSNQTDDVTQTPPGSGRKKFVQYNPISHAYEELEVTDSPWKSGRKLNLGYSPANQKVAEQQKQHQQQHQQQQVLLTSPQAQPSVYQSLNDSMTSLSLSDSSAPMPYGRRNR